MKIKKTMNPLLRFVIVIIIIIFVTVKWSLPFLTASDTALNFLGIGMILCSIILLFKEGIRAGSLLK